MFLLFQRLSNGSIDPDSDVNRVIELQETVEKQNSELTNTRTKMLEMNNKLTELDESYTSAQKDLIKAQEQVVKLQRDLREVSFVVYSFRTAFLHYWTFRFRHIFQIYKNVTKIM